MEILRSIQNRIYEIRGERVMLDFDLANLYGVEARALNQAVKRNIERFPDDFMFQLTENEWLILKSQIVMLDKTSMSSQFVTTYPTKRPLSSIPYAFTEQGIAMLSGILRSERAIQMNIAIMRAFVAIRKVLLGQHDFKEQIKLIKEKINEHDGQLVQIYDVLENLLDDKAAQRKWEERERIGFRK